MLFAEDLSNRGWLVAGISDRSGETMLRGGEFRIQESEFRSGR